MVYIANPLQHGSLACMGVPHCVRIFVRLGRARSSLLDFYWLCPRCSYTNSGIVLIYWVVLTCLVCWLVWAHAYIVTLLGSWVARVCPKCSSLGSYRLWPQCSYLGSFVCSHIMDCLFVLSILISSPLQGFPKIFIFWFLACVWSHIMACMDYMLAMLIFWLLRVLIP